MLFRSPQAPADLAVLSAEDLAKLRQLEDENRKLKTMVADLMLDNKILKDVNSKKW